MVARATGVSLSTTRVKEQSHWKLNCAIREPSETSRFQST